MKMLNLLKRIATLVQSWVERHPVGRHVRRGAIVIFHSVKEDFTDNGKVDASNLTGPDRKED